MKFSLPSLFAVAAFALSSGIAHADATTDALKTTLQKKFGGQADVSAVRKSPIAGLYEVTLGRQVIYSDATGRYVILGNIRDTATGEDLTQARTDELNRIDFAKLPLNDAVKVVHGKGERKIAVFSDPNCPYCHRLEETLQSVDNVTVYTFLYPILSPDSVEKSKAIWCTKDKGRAWEDWMLRRTAASAAPAGCDVTALERNLKLGQEMNVTGTPTVFLTDGNRLPGAVSADELKSRLASAH
ncbi:MAG: DsbC family protein [Janthinobacterium lividum]